MNRICPLSIDGSRGILIPSKGTLAQKGYHTDRYGVRRRRIKRSRESGEEEVRFILSSAGKYARPDGKGLIWAGQRLVAQAEGSGRSLSMPT